MFLYSCSEKGVSETFIKRIDLKVKKIDAFEENAFKFGDYFNCLTICQIPENQALIGQVDHCVIYNQKIYLLDIKYAKSLFVLSLEGEFLGSIKNIGKGKGEYLTITDFTVIDTTIVVYDGIQNKMINYNTANYSFINESKIGLNLDYFEKTHSSTYYHISGFDKTPYWLVVKDNNSGEINYFYSKNKYPVGKMPRKTKTLFRYKENVIFCHPFINGTLRFNGNKASSKILFDNYHIPKDFFKVDFIMEPLKMKDIYHNSIGIVNNYYENDDFIKLNYYDHDLLPNIIIINKKEEKFQLQNYFMDNIAFGGNRLYGDDKITISINNSSYHGSLIKNGVDNNKIVNKYYELPDLEINGNPILLIYKNTDIR